ncbi:MAG TPA: hypothetical protein PK490_15525 [Prosthecobacter sp.]|nr:hypothetical protein [Prosthecobacter sp.]
MRQIPGVKCHGGGKSWGIEGLWIDLPGEIDCRYEKAFSRFDTPFGEVRLIPVEDALAGRVYAARRYHSGYDEKDDDCAKKLMASALKGQIPIDWEEARRIVSSSKYNCRKEFEDMRCEVEADLAKGRSECRVPPNDTFETQNQPGPHLDLGAMAGGPRGEAPCGESRGSEKHPPREKRGV